MACTQTPQAGWGSQRFVRLGRCALVAAACWLAQPLAAALPAATPPEAPRVPLAKEPGLRSPVLLELFTSEGCSSCPPADELLRRLAEAAVLEDTPVIALEFHVDYWNYLGWRDPFSQAEFGARQAAYAQRFGLRGAYTPQLVIDGATEVVGSATTRIQAAALQASDAKKPVAISLSQQGTEVLVRVGASTVPGSVYLALTERGLATKIPAGENAGRTLVHGPVVRWLKRLGQTTQAAQTLRTPLAAVPRGRVNAFSLVAFVQAPNAGAILGATQESVNPQGMTPSP